MRGATRDLKSCAELLLISIHAPRAGRDDARGHFRARRLISIHAPRAGRDTRTSFPSSKRENFNPRAPCGARLADSIDHAAYTLFQSTRPVRGATELLVDVVRDPDISIHAPRAGRDTRASIDTDLGVYISIHAPRAGRDAAVSPSRRILYTFQSTRPVRGATVGVHRRVYGVLISIHAPRAGRDTAVYPRPCYRLDFNPRAPCGARPSQNSDFANVGEISIHAPRAGRDEFVGRVLTLYVNFNPRAPCGARPLIIFPGVRGKLFQSTRPVRGATWHEPATR